MAADHDKDVEMEMDEKLSSSRVSSISYPMNFTTSHVVFPSGLDHLSVDFSDVGRAGSFGFMELLGIPDLGPSLLDFSSEHAVPGQLDQPTVLEKTTTSDTTAGNPPATPNTSSISSSSTEAPADEQQPKRARDDNDQVMDKKVSKPKNKKQKKEREPRFAFMTKSEVDHLEDGYRWRKYGQKAVKNSPFPRSYYRCTSSMCGVKKRVERSCADPTIVVTTYEGQHTHPAGPRGSPAGLPPAHDHYHYSLTFAGRSGGGGGRFSLPAPQQQQQYQFHSYLENLQQPSPSIRPPLPSTSSLLRDNGLLQDMVNPDAKI